MAQHPGKKEPDFGELLDMLRFRLQSELLDAYACVNAHREALRLDVNAKQKIKLSPKEIIQFQTQLASRMNECKLQSGITLPLQGKAKEVLGDLLDEKNPKRTLLLEAGLMKGDEGWGFRHAEFQDYFDAVLRLSYGKKPEENRLAQLEAFLDRDIYDLKNKIRTS